MEDEVRLLVQERLGLEVESVVRIDRGWDTVVYELDGEWIVRVPRRPEVRGWMVREAALLRALSPALPVPVPDIAIVEDETAVCFAAYRKLEGEPLPRALGRGENDGRLAEQVGSFLAALHAFPRSTAIKAGLDEVSAGGWLAQQRAFAERCERVVGLLAAEEQRRARRMFATFFSLPHDFETAVIHGDLGPEHILVAARALSGVIDWSDARIGDPALDFAWLLRGPGESFADALLDAYGAVDDDLRARALFFHRLGPWHEVLHGLETDRPELVTSGLAGVRARLP